MLARVGIPQAGSTESTASLQAFDRGLLLWQPDTFQLLILHASGELSTFSSVHDLDLLGEPLAPARMMTARVQRHQRATLLWTEATGLLILYRHHWQLPLEGIVT